MIDASKQAFEENIRQTKEVVDYCHANSDATVEGELGTVSGVEDQIRVSEDEAALCNPQEAVMFVERTGWIFSRPPSAPPMVSTKPKPKDRFERMATINKMLNTDRIKTPLVVHGGTGGLPEEYVKRLLEAGGAKFNVSTELKHTLINTTRDYIAANPEQYDPGKSISLSAMPSVLS